MPKYEQHGEVIHHIKVLDYVLLTAESRSTCFVLFVLGKNVALIWLFSMFLEACKNAVTFDLCVSTTFN